MLIVEGIIKQSGQQQFDLATKNRQEKEFIKTLHWTILHSENNGAQGLTMSLNARK